MKKQTAKGAKVELKDYFFFKSFAAFLSLLYKYLEFHKKSGVNAGSSFLLWYFYHTFTFSVNLHRFEEEYFQLVQASVSESVARAADFNVLNIHMSIFLTTTLPWIASLAGGTWIQDCFHSLAWQSCLCCAGCRHSIHTSARSPFSWQNHLGWRAGSPLLLMRLFIWQISSRTARQKQPMHSRAFNRRS